MIIKSLIYFMRGTNYCKIYSIIPTIKNNGQNQEGPQENRRQKFYSN